MVDNGDMTSVEFTPPPPPPYVVMSLESIRARSRRLLSYSRHAENNSKERRQSSGCRTALGVMTQLRVLRYWN